MKLQISFDTTDLDQAVQIAHKTAAFADIFEIGTLLIYTHGHHAVTRFKKELPDAILLVDAKIVDRSKEAVSLFCQAGADWITVMAGTSKSTIHSACTTANKFGTKIMLDLLDSNSIGQSALEAKNLGASALLFHQPHDEEEPLIFVDKWEMVRGNTDLPIYVSAKINRTNIHEIMSVKPSGIIIGKSIIEAEDPAAQAAFFKQLISQL